MKKNDNIKKSNTINKSNNVKNINNVRTKQNVQKNTNNTNSTRNAYVSNRKVKIIAIIVLVVFFSIILNNSINHLELDLKSLAKFDFKITPQTVDIELVEVKTVTPISNIADIFLRNDAMVIGDSTAEGLPAYNVLNPESVVWVRGRGIQFMEADLGRVLAKQPKHLFLAYGANDLLNYNGNVTGYINACRNVFTSLKAQLPNTKLYVNSVLPVSETAAQEKPAFTYKDAFNEELKKLCDSLGIVFIDNEFILDQNTDGRKFESDGVHPRPFYYKLWAANMANEAGLK